MNERQLRAKITELGLASDRAYVNLLERAKNGTRPTMEEMMALHVGLNVIADLSAGKIGRES